MHPFVQGITTLLHKHSNHSNSVAMKAYMRNQFEFYGIQSTPRRELCAAYLKSTTLPKGVELSKVVKELWLLPQRELQYFAIELLIKCKAHWSEKHILLFEYLIVHKSWWDTVDYLSTWVVGPWLQLYPAQIPSITKKWNQSENIWLQRMSLLFQLKYKANTNTELMSQCIIHLSASKEFFVQKAIGWLLREYSKTNPTWVKKFLKENELMPLSKREALKIINRKTK